MIYRAITKNAVPWTQISQLNGLEDKFLLILLIICITSLSSLLHINGSNQNFTNRSHVNFHSSLGHR